MPQQPQREFCPPEKDTVIFVEGYDDFYIFRRICEDERIEGSVQIICYAEFGKLGAYLDLFVKDQKFDIVNRLGLTRDADADAAAARQSLTDAWRRAAQTARELSRQEPRQLAFVCPDNANPGRLEDVCLSSPTFPDILRCAEQMFECSSRSAVHAIDREKSLVSAYLSMMHRTGLRLGTGAQAGCFDLTSVAFTPLREFVRAVSRL